jgi:predicted exporter
MSQTRRSQLKNGRQAMRTWITTAITMAGVIVALGLLVFTSLPDIQQYLKIRKM